jgi:hypothetical protein
VLAGIESSPIGQTTFATGWHFYGARLLILPSLLTVAALAAVVVFRRLIIGTKRDRSLLSWMLMILLIGVWTGVLFALVRYPDAQILYRLRRDLWRYKIVAEAITTAGEIPASVETEIGEVRNGAFNTDRFPAAFRPYEHRSIHEDISSIWTLDDGALLFTVRPSRVALEFHPRGTRPGERFSMIKEGFRAINVPFAELGDGWFIVRRHQP